MYPEIPMEESRIWYWGPRPGYWHHPHPWLYSPVIYRPPVYRPWWFY